jgi:ParB/RepB/Spo0J family partition protein
MTQQIVEIPLDQLHVEHNPRKEFDDRAFRELQASIAVDGILDPIRVSPNADGYRIESGQRRYLAAQALKLATAPCIVVDQEAGAQTADEFVRAIVTNVQREDMNPVDEAEAFLHLIDQHGYTDVGVAERLGVAKQRVTERLDLLELPAPIRDLYRDRKLGVATRKSLRSIAKVSPEFATAIAKACAGKDEWQAVLVKEPGRVVGHVANESPKKWFPCGYQIERDNLKLSKDAKELLAKLDGKESWDRFRIRFGDDEVDAARAAGVLVEAKANDDRMSYVITDADYAAQLVEVICQRELKHREERAVAEAKRKAAQGKVDTGDKASDERAEAEKEARRAINEARAQGRIAARAHNLELGRWLLDNLATVKTDLSMEMVRLIATSILGPNRGEIFRAGLAYCLEEFQTEEKAGTVKKPKTKIVYIDTIGEAAEAFDKWMGRAKTPGDLLGRMWIAILAVELVDRGCVPQSGRHTGGLPTGSYGDRKWSTSGPRRDLAKKLVPAQLRPAKLPSEKLLDAAEKAHGAPTYSTRP